MLVANLKTRYRGTVSGFLWVIMSPIIMFGAQSFAFHYILRIRVDNYLLFLLSGLLPWIFIASSVDMSTTSLTNNARLLKSFPLNPLVSLGAQILDNLVNFMAAFFILLVPVALGSQIDLLSLPLLIVPFFSLFLGVFALSLILGTLNVFYRDTKFVVNFSTSVLFFLTPIFYPIDFLPESLRIFVYLNPIYYLINPFRQFLLNPWLPDTWNYIAQGYLVSVSFFCLALIFWSRKKNAVYFHL